MIRIRIEATRKDRNDTVTVTYRRLVFSEQFHKQTGKNGDLVSRKKKAAKIEIYVLFCVFRWLGTWYFDKMIIRLGLLLSRSVENPKRGPIFSEIGTGA